MAERTIDIGILNSIKKYIEEVQKHYKVDAIILFGSYAKGTNTEDSDIDIAVVSSDIKDWTDDTVKLMGLRWDIDLRIEPHPIHTDEFKPNETPFIDEVIQTGIAIYAA